MPVAILRSVALVALFALSPAVAAGAAEPAPYDTTAEWPEAPFGDKVGPELKNYLRATPYIGTSGVLGEGGVAAAKSLGFKTLVNLNTADEGAGAEAEAAKAAGLAYVDLPISTKAPTAEQVAAFAKVAEESLNYPILVHCESANRVGALWALYRASRGVPGEIAIQEGRTIGLKQSREPAVREQLGLPAIN